MPAASPCRLDQEVAAGGQDAPDYFETRLVNAYGLDAIEYLLEPVRRSRDVVLVDQRGTGKSGALECDFSEFERAAQQRGRGKFERGRARMDRKSWPFRDERASRQARRRQKPQANRSFQRDPAAETFPEFPGYGGAVLRPVDKRRHGESGRKRDHQASGNDRQNIAQAPSFDSTAILAHFVAFARRQGSRADRGFATLSSGRRSAATPQRSATPAAPIMQAAPNR